MNHDDDDDGDEYDMNMMRLGYHDDALCHQGARKEEDDRSRDSSS